MGSLDRKLSWLNKPQHLAFTSLRAYPHLQLRKMCVVLRGNSLPLDRYEVLILFKQALYHLGDLSDMKDRTSLLWRGCGEEGYSILHEELQKSFEELKDSPKNYLQMHLIAEVAAYLTERWPMCRDLCRQIAESFSVWTLDLDEEVDQLTTTETSGDLTTLKIIQEKRAKQHILYAHSLLCHKTGSLDDEDATRIVRLTALFSFLGTTVYTQRK